MDHPIAEEESYADRRQLFKNIWETTIHVNKKFEEQKQRNVTNIPKVIKTVRLVDDVNRGKAEKKKKQRLRNLRIVCNKLLHFCEQQDADDVFYDQKASKEWESSMRSKGRMPRKSKIAKISNANRAKWHSMFIMENSSQTGTTSPDSQLDKSSRSSSPNKENKTSLNVPEQNCKRPKRKRVAKFPDPKMFKPACERYPNKRLFPINKILIH